MKKMSRVIIAVAFLFATTSTFAQSNEPVIHVIGDDALVLTINKLPSDLDIQVKDEYGYKLYKQSVNADELTYQKKFSLATLPNGVYNVEIEDDLKVISTPVTVKDSKILRNEIVAATSFKPVVYKKGEDVYVSHFSTGKEPLKVVIYDNNYDVLHEETIAGAKVDKGRVYKFENAGDYTIALVSNNKSYEHTVSINK